MNTGKKICPLIILLLLTFRVLIGWAHPSPPPFPSPIVSGVEEVAVKFQTESVADSIKKLEQKLKADPRSQTARYLLARALHLKGVDGDVEAAERALKMMEEISATQPENPLVIAYLGSAIILKARRALLPWQKGKLVKEGLTLLDRAIVLAPTDLEVRFVRGVSSYPLPFFFDREDQAAADFAFAAARAEEAAAGGEIDKNLAAGVHYYHGLCLEDDDRPEEARRSWEKAAAIAPGSSFARAAAEKLASDD